MVIEIPFARARTAAPALSRKNTALPFEEFVADIDALSRAIRKGKAVYRGRPFDVHKDGREGALPCYHVVSSGQNAPSGSQPIYRIYRRNSGEWVETPL